MHDTPVRIYNEQFKISLKLCNPTEKTFDEIHTAYVALAIKNAIRKSIVTSLFKIRSNNNNLNTYRFIKQSPLILASSCSG